MDFRTGKWGGKFSHDKGEKRRILIVPFMLHGRTRFGFLLLLVEYNLSTKEGKLKIYHLAR